MVRPLRRTTGLGNVESSEFEKAFHQILKRDHDKAPRTGKWVANAEGKRAAWSPRTCQQTHCTYCSPSTAAAAAAVRCMQRSCQVSLPCSDIIPCMYGDGITHTSCVVRSNCFVKVAKVNSTVLLLITTFKGALFTHPHSIHYSSIAAAVLIVTACTVNMDAS